MNNEKKLTHVAGTFLIQAEGAFLNGAGLDSGEDRNATIPKTFLDIDEKGRRIRVPYVSAQAWRRWLRLTFQEENPNEPAAILKSLHENARGNTDKIGTDANPVDFAEDDIFGYMRAEKGQGKSKEVVDENADELFTDQENTDDVPKKAKTEKVSSVMRVSPFVSSILKSLRKDMTVLNDDEGFVHLKVGSPLPYKTKFYNTQMQGVFGLNYERLGVFRNDGDRIELDAILAKQFMSDGKVQTQEGKTNIYEIADNKRRERATMILKALAVLRGGAKQAQFGTDVSPKAIIVAGLNCGNLIFNDLFTEMDGKPCIKIDALKQIIDDYQDRIVTPVFVGVREGYLHPQNYADLKQWIESGENTENVRLSSPIKAVDALTEQLS
jgi:CRISPR-associated protein Cst2